MKSSNTATRLKELMDERGLRQVDILNAAKPYCEKYGIKLQKNDLSQYINGKVEPGQEKLTILGLALDVSETWLMGYDVPRDRKPISDSKKSSFKMGTRDGSEIMFALSRGGKAEITDEMYEEVKRFAAYVAQREGRDNK